MNRLLQSWRENEITRRTVIMGVAAILIVLLVSWLFNGLAERREVDYNEEVARIKGNLQTALDRNRDLEAAAAIQRETIRKLESIAAAEREAFGRLEESDNRSREAVGRIERIVAYGDDIIDELIQFFESYEN